MKCLLITLSVALVCGSQAMFVPQNVKDLDIQKVAGTWYSLAMAATDFARLNPENGALRMYIKELTAAPEDKLEIVLQRWEDDRCIESKMFAEKTDMPAQFQIDDLEDSKVFVLDTDYENYAFLCMEDAAATEQSLACQYLARTPKVDEAAMEQFNNAMRLLSIPTQLLLTPTQLAEKCHA